MDDFAKYLRQTSEELKTLQDDIVKMIVAKQAEQKKKNKDETGKDKKELAKEQFKKVSLKSIQPVTKLYKNEKEIEDANNNPEQDFISNRLKEIFNK